MVPSRSSFMVVLHLWPAFVCRTASSLSHERTAGGSLPSVRVVSSFGTGENRRTPTMVGAGVGPASAAAFLTSSAPAVRRRSQRLLRPSLGGSSSSSSSLLADVAGLAEDVDGSATATTRITTTTTAAATTTTPPVPVTPSPKRGATRKRKSPPLASPMRPPDVTASSSFAAAAAVEAAAAAAAASGTATNGPPDGVLTSDVIAALNPSQHFVDLRVPPEELRPSATLTTGQCFHWKVVHPITAPSPSPPTAAGASASAWGTHDATEWVGTLRLARSCQQRDGDDNSSIESVVLVVRETPTTTLFRPLTAAPPEAVLRDAVRAYFQLDVPLRPLYESWSSACPRLAAIAACIPGVRVLDQDPWECLVSFLCSSNNNIPRITQILSSLRREYGRPLLPPFPPLSSSSSLSPAGATATLTTEPLFYSFPSLDDLMSKANEDDLRTKCGMGYRAKYLIETMRLLHTKGGEDYLHRVLRRRRGADVDDGNGDVDDDANCVEAVQARLCEFHGVGRKVADCVALFSLGQTGAIPVDTHVWNIAVRDYDVGNVLRGDGPSSLTPATYARVGDIFRRRFPDRPGWAHSLLFVAELPSFRRVLPDAVVREMDDFRRREQQRKKEVQDEKKMKKKTTDTKKER